MSLHKAWRAGGGRPEERHQRESSIIHIQGTVRQQPISPNHFSKKISNAHSFFLYDCRRIIPNNDCKVVLHCWSLSPGSAVGKKTAAGIPGPAESRRNPTAVSRACQPGTPPTLFSTLCWEVYMEFRCPFCILWRDFSTCKYSNMRHQYCCLIHWDTLHHGQIYTSLTKWSKTLKASRARSGYCRISAKACPMREDGLLSLTSLPINMYPGKIKLKVGFIRSSCLYFGIYCCHNVGFKIFYCT